MTLRTVEQIEADKAGIQSNSDAFIQGLERELETAKSQRMTEPYQQKLNTEIAQARSTYGAMLDRLEGELTVAKEAEARAALVKQREIEQTAAQTKEVLKAQLKTAWIKAGGDLQVFETQFPQLYAAEMTKRALGQRDPEESRAHRDVIARSF